MGQLSANVDIGVETVGDVTGQACEAIRAQVVAFLREVPYRVGPARVKLTALARRGSAVSVLAQANVVLADQPVRTQVAASSFAEAALSLRTRLHRQAARLARPDRPRDWPESASSQPVVAGHEGKIVRHKRFALLPIRPDAAALTMDLLDYDFHLFVDADTGSDAMLYRVGPTGYRLARISGMAPPTRPVVVPLTIHVYPVPDLTPAQAVVRLEETEVPFRFFRDPATGRGSVLYRRFDGDYGLITT